MQTLANNCLQPGTKTESKSLSLVVDEVEEKQIGGLPPPPREARPKKVNSPATEGYQPFVEHVMETYQRRKGVKLLFGAREGKIVKSCLSNYPLAHARALWDVFLGKDWNWRDRNDTLVRVPHDLVNFQLRWTVCAEEPGFRALVEKYEAEQPRNEAQARQVAGLLAKMTEPKTTAKSPGGQP